MSQRNGHHPSPPLEPDEFAPSLRPTGAGGWPFGNPAGAAGLFQNIPLAGVYVGLWNRYLNLVVEAQQAFMRANQSILRIYGIPTSEDIVALNRQLFETNLRLDQLEAKIEARESQ